jgi:hypothetical protein
MFSSPLHLPLPVPFKLGLYGDQNVYFWEKKREKTLTVREEGGGSEKLMNPANYDVEWDDIMDVRGRMINENGEDGYSSEDEGDDCGFLYDGVCLLDEPGNNTGGGGGGGLYDDVDDSDVSRKEKNSVFVLADAIPGLRVQGVLNVSLWKTYIYININFFLLFFLFIWNIYMNINFFFI